MRQRAASRYAAPRTRGCRARLDPPAPRGL